MAIVTWAGGGDETSWNDAANWSTAALPQPADDVVINSGMNTIVYSSGTSTIHSLQSANAFTLSDGSLTARGSMALGGGDGSTPDQIRTAYGLNSLPTTSGGAALDGTGQTIAIVDAYNDTNIFTDLNGFDQQFGTTSSGPTLFQQYGAAASFLTVLNQSGNSGPLPGNDPGGPSNSSWELEESLDIEWLHVLAPGAKIVLVEANTTAWSDLTTAALSASQIPGVSVVSMSWGITESGSDTAGEEATFDETMSAITGVSYVAATGDQGGGALYPATSPDVLSVGGTSLQLNTDNSYQSETAWSSSAGGFSQFESKPTYQDLVLPVNQTKRSSPDVAFDANMNTGVTVYDSYDNTAAAPFSQDGGTSLGASIWSALIALANQGRQANGDSAFNSASSTETLSAIYSLPKLDFHDVTTGANKSSSATAGFDQVTGLGTPVANLLVPDLIAYGNSVSLTPGSLATGTIGAAYSQSITANGGTGGKTMTYNIMAGALPAGLSINVSNSELDIVGTPVSAGSVTFKAIADDTDGEAANQTYVLTIAGLAPSVTVSDPGGTFTGNPFPASALVNGAASLDGVTPTLAYYVGSTATGPSSSAAPSAIGTYTVVANFAGSADYSAASSAPLTFSINSAPTAATVGIPVGIAGKAGQTVNVPVSITDNAFGIASADFAFDYNPALLTLTNSDVTLSSYLTGLADWSLAVNANNAQGVVFVSMSSATGLGLPDGTPQLLNLAFTVASSAPFGSTPVTIDPNNSDLGNSTGKSLTLSVSNGSVSLKALPTVTVSDAGGTYTGNPFPATALVNGFPSLEGVAPTLTYYVGTTTTSTPSSTAPTAVGTYTVVASFAGSTDYSAASSVQVTFSVLPFEVSSFTPNSTGFAIGLDAAPNLSLLNLYSGFASALGTPDMTVLNGSTAVQGSLIWDASTLTATFVQTRGVLAPGTYTVTLASRADGWVDTHGNLLGAGSNYTNTFTVAAPTAPILTLPDFARGPGQSVNVSDASNSYGTALTSSLPVALSDTTGVTSVSFELDYNASYLTVSGVQLAAGISGTLSVTNTTPGVLLVSITGFSSTASAGAIGGTDIVDISASVPTAAISSYGASAILKITGAQINSAAVADSEALEKVVYFGDANADGKLSAADASLVARNRVHLDGGFSAYALTDPRVIGNVTGTGSLTSGDASLLAQVGVHLPVAKIPTVPSHGTITLAGTDPTVGIPTGIAATAGQTVSVPVSILDSASGVASADFAIHYDPAVLSLTNSGITLGSTLASLGWTINRNVDNADGVAYVSLSATAGLLAGTPQLLNLAFSVASTGSTGTTAVTIDPDSSDLADASGKSLPLSVHSGSVAIAGLPTAPMVSTKQAEPAGPVAPLPATLSPVDGRLAMAVSLGTTSPASGAPRAVAVTNSLPGTPPAGLHVEGTFASSAAVTTLDQATLDALLTRGNWSESERATQADAADAVMADPLLERWF